ncbi:MAG: 50S ribosomal protein L13 [Patescibacteria group bacterium]
MEYILDAKNKKLGRLASEAAQILQGKKNPDYNPRNPGKDRVVIKNASLIEVSGDKANQKIYQYHTGYMGHLRAKKFKEMMAKQPQKVLEWAIYNMLPKNFLRQKRMNMLKIER